MRGGTLQNAQVWHPTRRQVRRGLKTPLAVAVCTPAVVKSNVGFPSLKISTVKFPVNGPTRKRFATLDEVASGEEDILGWSVVVLSNGEAIGNVHELIPIQPAKEREVFQYLMCVLDPRNAKARYLIPMVDAIVKAVDRKSRCLTISPPSGLLELGRRQEKLEKLQLALFDYKRSKNKTSQETTDEEERMPTRLELLSEGRRDLVNDILEAGGFLSVAQELNLRACRRPDGFWDNVDHIDVAIERFIENSWILTTSSSEGKSCYYNEVTREVSLQTPPAGNLSASVMPRQKAVISARKWDLHHAIRLHGGYRSVAKELGRDFVPPYTFTNLVEDFQTFIHEHDMSYFPQADEVRAKGRPDLVYLARKFGGLQRVAKETGMVRKHERTFPVAVNAFKAYISGKLPEEEQRLQDASKLWEKARAAGLKLPTILQVEKDGRTDLRYMLRKFGHLSLAKELRIGVSSTRGSKRLKEWNRC